MGDRGVAGTIGPGDHVCLTFSDAEERMDLMAAFVRNGLRASARVVCWTDAHGPERLATELARRSVRARAAVRRGQLEIAPVSTSLLGGARADAARMVDALAGELDLGARDGYSSVRVTVDMGWATRPLAAAEELVAFESAVADLFTDGRLCLICQYDRDRFDAVTLAFAAKAHPKTLTAQVYFEHPLLRICRQYSPPGVRIAGELDYRYRDILEQALGESMRLDRHMHVNLAKLHYIDGACAGSVTAAAARLPASRRMTVICRRSVATVLDLVGGGAAPRLRVQAFDEQN